MGITIMPVQYHIPWIPMAEIDLQIGLCGCRSVSEIDKSLITRAKLL